MGIESRHCRKALLRPRNYTQELKCYQRLRTAGVTKLEGFNVPKLIAHNDELMIVELGIVTPPWLLDFAKGSIDQPPDYDAETLEADRAESEELFGPQYWPRVSALLWLLRSKFGIYYLDAKPGNVMFSDWPRE